MADSGMSESALKVPVLARVVRAVFRGVLAMSPNWVKFFLNSFVSLDSDADLRICVIPSSNMMCASRTRSATCRPILRARSESGGEYEDWERHVSWCCCDFELTLVFKIGAGRLLDLDREDEREREELEDT